MICPFCKENTMFENDDGNKFNTNYNFCFNCMTAYSKQQIAKRVQKPSEENEIKEEELTNLVSKKEIIIFAIVLFIVVLLCFVANIQNRCL